MQEHDITTLGLLLGLAASHRGTMDPAISKVLTSVRGCVDTLLLCGFNYHG